MMSARSSGNATRKFMRCPGITACGFVSQASRVFSSYTKVDPLTAVE